MEAISQPTPIVLRRFTPQFFIGLALIAIFWFASWTHLNLIGEFSFFPLWLGYILTMDGLVALRGRASLLQRAPRKLVALFGLSAPAWWLFEGLNQFTLNWHYLSAQNYSATRILLESTIDFSTVIPAVFETTEFISTFAFAKNLRVPPLRIPLGARAQWALMYLGAGLLLGVIWLPKYFFPALWLWGFFLIDPLNWMRGRASLLAQMANGDWRTAGALALGVLICGFFWEMWNFFAMPKWFYTVPFFEFGKIFEMPILGYLGYIPFAWELYALYQLACGVLRIRQPEAGSPNL